MKKLLAAILLLGLIFTLTACGGGTTSPTPTPTATTQEPEATPEPEPEEPTIEYPPISQHGYADIAIVGTEIVEYSDETCLKVVYDMTNTAPGPVNLLGNFSIHIKAYQNDKELTFWLVSADGSEETKNQDRHIAPGATGRVAICYFPLSDLESPVTIEIPKQGSPDKEYVTLDLNNLLPQLPWPERDASVNPPLETESFLGEETTFVQSNGESYRLKMLDHEFFEHDGDNYIRVRYEFENLNEENTMRISGRLDNYYFQDGIQLGYCEWKNEDLMLTEEDSNVTATVEAGDTLVFAHVFKLWSDSPVVARVGDLWWRNDEEISPPYIGALFTIE